MADELTRKSVDSSVRLALGGSPVQTASHQYYEREPGVKEIPDQGFVLALVSGTCYIYTRVGTQRYKVALTAV